MHARIIAIFLCGTVLLVFSGCGLLRENPFQKTEESQPGAGVALTGHNPVSLHNYKTARAYSLQGRFELAREHYLLAHAAAEGDLALQNVLEKELVAVDKMIKTLR